MPNQPKCACTANTPNLGPKINLLGEGVPGDPGKGRGGPGSVRYVPLPLQNLPPPPQKPPKPPQNMLWGAREGKGQGQEDQGTLKR